MMGIKEKTESNSPAEFMVGNRRGRCFTNKKLYLRYTRRLWQNVKKTFKRLRLRPSSKDNVSASDSVHLHDIRENRFIVLLRLKPDV